MLNYYADVYITPYFNNKKICDAFNGDFSQNETELDSISLFRAGYTNNLNNFSRELKHFFGLDFSNADLNDFIFLLRSSSVKNGAQEIIVKDQKNLHSYCADYLKTIYKDYSQRCGFRSTTQIELRPSLAIKDSTGDLLLDSDFRNLSLLTQAYSSSAV